jgi:predicted ATPase/DNA-binding SARP family transcriptional activator/tetratricopeptide (TPR) repeat protein
MAPLERVDVRLLGRPALRRATGWVELPATRSAAILCYLAFHGGWVGRGELAYLLWPDAPEARARANLRPLLSRASRLAQVAPLERERSRVRWSVASDARSFRSAIAARRWREAWSWVGGELLEGFDLAAAPVFERWLDDERDALRAVSRGAGLRAADDLEASGDRTVALTVLSTLERRDPLDEEAIRAYIAALAADGARREALETFERLRRALADEVGAEPEAATLTLVDRVRAGAPAPDGERPGGARFEGVVRLGGVPLQVTPMVGREAERTALNALLLDPGSRLVTIVGAGGVGKTRLAAQVASEASAHFRDGAVFVDLSAVESKVGVAVAAARALGMTTTGGSDAWSALMSQLADREVLLVLDNVEHLVGRLDLVGELLEGTSSVTVLATSRLRLGHPGERVVHLDGLSFPGSGAASGPYDAVVLFVRAARAVRPEVRLPGDDGATIGTICRLVEGLPLAVELAASWLRVLTLAQLEAELRDGLGLLDRRPRDERGQHDAGRHAGLRAVVERSWKLLRPEQRHALRAVSVFRGGWTREGASEVANVGLPTLLALVEASMVQRDAAGRFTLHPVVAQYARDRAAEEPDLLQATQERHWRTFLGLLAERTQTWRRMQEQGDVAELDVEWDNITVAWRAAVAARCEDALADACDGLGLLGIMNGRLHLVVTLLTDALATARPDGLLRGKALINRGFAEAWMQRNAWRGEQWPDLEEGLRLLDGRASDADVAWACRLVGVCHVGSGHRDEARDVFERAMCIHRALGDVAGVAMMRNNLAGLASTFDESVREFREAISFARDAGAPWAEAMAATNLAQILFLQSGQDQEPRRLLARAIDLLDAAGFRVMALHATLQLAEVLVGGGRLEEARAVAHDARLRAAAVASSEVVQYAAATEALLAWIAWIGGDASAAEAWCRDLLALGGHRVPAPVLARVRLILAELARRRGDHEVSSYELRLARVALEGAPPPYRARGQWYDHLPVFWVRVHAAAVALAVERGDEFAAREAAAQALEVAARRAQEPPATLALAAAAAALEVSGEADAAAALSRYVRQHPATPFDARSPPAAIPAGVAVDAEGRDAAGEARLLEEVWRGQDVATVLAQVQGIVSELDERFSREPEPPGA